MSKHTPGPWRVGNTEPLLFGRPQGNGSVPIGFVYGPSFSERSEVGQRALADARLCAAAPELLEALRNLYMSAPTSTECNAFHHSKEERHAGFEPRQPAKDYLSALSHASAAIAKATGEQL